MEQSQAATLPKEAELEERVNRDPFDSDAWEELARIASEGENIDKVRSVMERMLKQFPFAFSEWVRYLKLEQSLGTEVSNPCMKSKPERIANMLNQRIG